MTPFTRKLLTLPAIGVAVALALSGDARPGSSTDVDGAEVPVDAIGTTVSGQPLPCPPGGYLCARVDGAPEVRIRRWPSETGTLVVHVPPPDFEPPAEATRLQSAAAAGVRAWNGQPFPVRVELRSGEGAHFSVVWTRQLGGSVVGVARTRWDSVEGLRATSIDLATRNPFDPSRPIDPQRVRLTAAHEMGHALGLPHSDSDQDVMYPSNTASSLSARDYRSMEALYGLPDGSLLAP